MVCMFSLPMSEDLPAGLTVQYSSLTHAISGNRRAYLMAKCGPGVQKYLVEITQKTSMQYLQKMSQLQEELAAQLSDGMSSFEDVQAWCKQRKLELLK